MLKLQVIGFLGRDCNTNTVNNRTVINFTVAHTEKFKDAQGNPKDKTIWVDCAYWSDRTGIVPYLLKGTQIHVDGVPDIRTYTKQDGQMGVSLTCRVLSIQLLGAANNQNQVTQSQPAATTNANGSQLPDDWGPSQPNDDVPF